MTLLAEPTETMAWIFGTVTEAAAAAE